MRCACVAAITWLAATAAARGDGAATATATAGRSSADQLAWAEENLRARPGDAQFAWARAEALAGLGLPRTAAEAYAALAARAVRSDEARRRAAELRAEVAEAERGRVAAEAAGREMIQSGLAPSAELTRAYPGIIRRALYDAIRTAGAGPRALALLPVAQLLDRLAGGQFLEARVRAAARGDAVAALDPAKASPRALKRAADKTRDPWWIALADEAAGRDLARADERCLAAQIEYRCAFLEYALAKGQYPESAEGTARAGLARARAAGIDPRDLPRRFLVLLSELARARGAGALADAYVGEARATMP